MRCCTRCCPKHTRRTIRKGGPVLVFPSSHQNTPANIPGGLPHRQNCIRPDTGLHKNARSDNIPFEHTRFGDPLQTGEFAPLRHIGVSHSHGYAAVILSAQPCAVDIEPADSDFSRAARRFISRRNRRYNRAPFPKLFSPHWSGVQKEAVYKWVRISGLSLLHDIRITEIHPETTRTNPSGTGFPALEAFHRLTVTAAGKTLQLHGFTVEGICCVYGIG
ncbi:MAG: hypothetical protein ACLR8Y_00675 [Alistipes indistinctus]